MSDQHSNVLGVAVPTGIDTDSTIVAGPPG